MTALLTKTTRKRNIPTPVHGTARWIGGTPTQGSLDDGDAILSITTAGNAAQCYRVGTVCDEAGLRLGYDLTKLDAKTCDTVYHVDTTFGGGELSCDCPDATYANRPGGCKHCVALKAALKAANIEV